MLIIHISHKNINKLKRRIICIEIILFFSCHFYNLKPTYFIQTYCFTIFAWILLKFCDIT